MVPNSDVTLWCPWALLMLRSTALFMDTLAVVRDAELALCGFTWVHLGRCVGLHEPHREWACRFCMNDDGTCLGGHGLGPASNGQSTTC